MTMGYSGWRFSCDRATMERCAGALEIRAGELCDRVEIPGASIAVPGHAAAFAMGAAAALRCILADGDGIDPAEYVGQVMSRIGVE